MLHVLYLMFNEGYVSSAGAAPQQPDLTREAIRLTRVLHRLVPADGEIAGLLALMLLTDARRPARTSTDGLPVPLAEQRRDLWDRTLIAPWSMVHAPERYLALRAARLGEATTGD